MVLEVKFEQYLKNNICLLNLVLLKFLIYQKIIIIASLAENIISERIKRYMTKLLLHTTTPAKKLQ